jgi:hypothetical protein
MPDGAWFNTDGDFDVSLSTPEGDVLAAAFLPIETSPNSFGYQRPNGELAGEIFGLKSEEMEVLRQKHGDDQG